MQLLDKTLAAVGLALVTGSFAVATWAVDYVDQETKRAELAQVAPDDPYAPRGTQAYPTTSFGASTPPAPAAPAPAAPAAGAPGAPAYAPAPAPVNAVAPAAAPVAAQPVMQQPQDQNLGALFMQIQQLQQQIMLINGRLEEQANELRTLQEQSLQRYVDLDRRLGGAAAVGAAAAAPTTPASPTTPVGAASNPASAPAAALATPPGPVAAAPAAAQPGEAEAYEAAYSLVRSQKFDQAVTAFQQFQRNYPAGMYAPNAYYWLGELYLVVQPPDLESSRQAFTMLLSQYPDNSKAPDALYKLGKVQCMKGNREKAKEYLDQVISRYGSTNSSAVKLAREFNYETC